MELRTLTSHRVDRFGSHGATITHAVHSGPVDGFHVAAAQLTAGAMLGRHPAASWQLFTVITGERWVSGVDGVRHPITAGQAALWEPGEDHESGTDTGLTAVIVESPTRPPVA